MYALGAARRFVAVRYCREKLAAGGSVTVDTLADADAALATHRDGDAASAFASTGQLVQGLRDDAHVRNPGIRTHLDALGRACGMPTAICEHRTTDHPTTGAPTTDAPVTDVRATDR